MRGKEEAHDYRYFPEPDLVPIRIDGEWVERIQAGIPELRSGKIRRYVDELGLPEYDAQVLTAEASTAGFFEEILGQGVEAKKASNWVMGEYTRLLKERGPDSARISPAQVAGIIRLVDASSVSVSGAKQVFEEVFATGKDPEAVVREKGLMQVSDEGAIEGEIRKILEASPAQVQQFKDGQEKVLGYFVGQVMKATKGTANPRVVNEILIRILKE